MADDRQPPTVLRRLSTESPCREHYAARDVVDAGEVASLRAVAVQGEGRAFVDPLDETVPRHVGPARRAKLTAPSTCRIHLHSPGLNLGVSNHSIHRSLCVIQTHWLTTPPFGPTRRLIPPQFVRHLVAHKIRLPPLHAAPPERRHAPRGPGAGSRRHPPPPGDRPPRARHLHCHPGQMAGFRRAHHPIKGSPLSATILAERD